MFVTRVQKYTALQLFQAHATTLVDDGNPATANTQKPRLG
jgi:hypothetical protein